MGDAAYTIDQMNAALTVENGRSGYLCDEPFATIDATRYLRLMNRRAAMLVAHPERGGGGEEWLALPMEVRKAIAADTAAYWRREHMRSDAPFPCASCDRECCWSGCTPEEATGH